MALALPSRCFMREEGERTIVSSPVEHDEGLFGPEIFEEERPGVSNTLDHDEELFGPLDCEGEGPAAAATAEEVEEDDLLKQLEDAFDETNQDAETVSDDKNKELNGELFGEEEFAGEKPAKQVGGLALPKAPAPVRTEGSKAVALPTPYQYGPEAGVSHVDSILGDSAAAVVESHKRKRLSEDNDDHESEAESERPIKKAKHAFKYRCRYGCSELLAGINTLRSHSQKVHNLFYDKPVGTCNACGKKFANQKDCDRHWLRFPMCHGENVRIPATWNVTFPPDAQARADTLGLKTDGEVSPHLIVYPNKNGVFPSADKLPELPSTSKSLKADRPARKDSQQSDLAQAFGGLAAGPILIDDDHHHDSSNTVSNSGNPIVIDDDSKAVEVDQAVHDVPGEAESGFHDSEEEFHRWLSRPFDINAFVDCWFGEHGAAWK